ncbi:hypothetical protein CDAR_76351 [Caerostris darwini]|uniref:Uncharacterized protein n=1 Tax=Caerostris darwini TaxID=1538125 RepID=A0AAV4QUA4_9ARAC|nr:hypothetical protein CDAR_76351 [Caerostris darwini]
MVNVPPPIQLSCLHFWGFRNWTASSAQKQEQGVPLPFRGAAGRFCCVWDRELCYKMSIASPVSPRVEEVALVFTLSNSKSFKTCFIHPKLFYKHAGVKSTGSRIGR